MKRIIMLMFTVIMLIFTSVPVMADGSYIEKTFVFPGYSPVISIDHGSYNWTLEMKNDGTLKWTKNRDRNNQKQLFDILPASESGYFIIREHTYEHSQRVLTYTPNGFVMIYPGSDDYGMQIFTKSQMFRFKWVNGCWQLACAENNICFCNGGWSKVKLFQGNI